MELHFIKQYWQTAPPPTGGRGKQHHTKDGEREITTTHKEGGGKREHPTGARATTTLLDLTLLYLTEISCHLIFKRKAPPPKGGRAKQPPRREGKAAPPATDANSKHISLANSQAERTCTHTCPAPALPLPLPAPALRCAALPTLSCTMRLPCLPASVLPCPLLRCPPLLLPCPCPVPSCLLLSPRPHTHPNITSHSCHVFTLCSNTLNKKEKT